MTMFLLTVADLPGLLSPRLRASMSSEDNDSIKPAIKVNLQIFFKKNLMI